MSIHTAPRSRRLRTALALTAIGSVFAVTACSGAGGGGGADGAVTLNIATVSNPDMERMQELAPEFEKSHPGVTVKFTILPENTLRDRLTQDVATGSGAYDIATVGVFEVPGWAENGWIDSVQQQAENTEGYDLDDILPSVKDSLSHEGELHAVPFYAESSFVMYRKDLFQAAGLTMPEKPTWDDIAGFAAKLHDPADNVAGICLRGGAGWGSIYGALGTVVHAYGGHFYDTDYNAGFTDPEFTEAANFYVDLIRNYGQPGASSSAFAECLNTFTQGNAAMWYDSTAGASAVTDPAQNANAANVGFAPAPSAKLDTGGWLWAWSLALVSSSKKKDAAWDFMSWATSKEYIQLVAEKFGANLIPPGTRASTYELPEYQEAAGAYADLTLEGIQNAQTEFEGAAPSERSFYIAQQWWQDTGTATSQFLTEAVAGSTSTDDALKKAQELANQAAIDQGLQR